MWRFGSICLGLLLPTSCMKSLWTEDVASSLWRCVLVSSLREVWERDRGGGGGRFLRPAGGSAALSPDWLSCVGHSQWGTAQHKHSPSVPHSDGFTPSSQPNLHTACVRACVCVYVWECVYVHTHTHIYIYIYIHTICTLPSSYQYRYPAYFPHYFPHWDLMFSKCFLNFFCSVFTYIYIYIYILIFCLFYQIILC